jgi:tetratricopeptide (TPR) repeat protein
MRKRPQIVLLFAACVLGSACARVQSKAAYQDGNKFYKEENYKRAIEKYARAVELDPTMAEAYFYLGSSHQQLFRPGKESAENTAHIESAIENYKKSLELNSGVTPNLKAVRANALGALTAIYAEEPNKSYEAALKYAQDLVKEAPDDARNLYAMANLYEKFGHVPEAEETYRKVTQLYPKDVKACSALAGFYNKTLWDGKSRFGEAIATLERCAELDPTDAGGFQKVASFYWDKAYRDPLLDDKSKNAYADKGLQNVDKALAIKPEYFEAVIYKGLLFRVKAAVATNPTLRMQYLEDAQTLQKQGLELKKQQEATQAASASAAPPAK